MKQDDFRVAEDGQDQKRYRSRWASCWTLRAASNSCLELFRMPAGDS
jgi:hypothetical protein